MPQLAIVPCSKQKIWDIAPELGAVPAAQAYRSGFHRLAAAYAQQLTPHWLIFSAKYGLLLPEDLIPATYDVTFSRPCDPVVSMRKLRQQAADYADARQIVSLCPRLYGEKIEQAFAGRAYVVHPLRGVGGWGSMHRWLRAQL